MTQTNRITGYDFARGLAILGMIIVNFKTVMVVPTADSILYQILELLSGKAAALFVVLAGVGMTLMHQSAVRKKNPIQIRKVKISLLKRSVFLFVIGLSYYFIWPADILHYYGLYLAIGVIFISSSRQWLINISVALAIAFSFMVLHFDYEKGWDWNTLEYLDFFTLQGFFRNMFFNGFHPVIPWIAFLFTGIWIGRINLKDRAIRVKTRRIAGILFVVTNVVSFMFVHGLTALSPSEAEDMKAIFGTEPMPPMIFYMLSGSSLAVFVISISVSITEKFQSNLVIKQLISTGQLALTNYFAHVVIGMLGIQLIFGELEQAFSINFVFAYSILFCMLVNVFSHWWKSKYTRGPLEWIMRKITG